MKHLRLFETEAAFEAAKENLEQPWVALTEDDSKVYYAQGEPQPTYEMVDLGLPSGLKWASCNLGATKPEEYGLYFQWADTIGYTAEQVANGEKVFNYNTTPYQTNKSAGTSTSATKFTKYLGSTTSTYKDPSATDEDALKTVLDPEDDAAYVATGGAMRMPTEAEFKELLSGTTNAWTTENGVYGRKFTSKTDSSKYIFIPAAGALDNTRLRFSESEGYIWNSTLGYNSKTGYTESFRSICSFFDNSECVTSNFNRCYGMSIRGVQA